jgi:hypothetical protein
MALLSKTHDITWRREGMGPNQGSNLDHALATTNLLFQALIDPRNDTPASVSVDGWSHLSGAARDDFTENVSDHCSLFCRIV